VAVLYISEKKAVLTLVTVIMYNNLSLLLFNNHYNFIMYINYILLLKDKITKHIYLGMEG